MWLWFNFFMNVDFGYFVRSIKQFRIPSLLPLPSSNPLYRSAVLI